MSERPEMGNINVKEYRRGSKKKGQSRETGNIGYTRRWKKQPRHNTICDGHHYTQTNTNNVHKGKDILQQVST